ncbi:MAG TPA: BTAD domain-containing putative transcriptional regulator, partial [Caldilineaceae bacterium]|nr:BTAD domain-containing putative transcriptional regulator [Caldilineaceae bacterium]
MFRLTLFGYPKVEVDTDLIHSSRRKAVALLAYLAVTEKSHGRETLANLLWSGYPSATSLAHLRRTLHTIRTDLGIKALIVERNQIALDLTHDVWCDVTHFRHVLGTFSADCQHHPYESCATCLAHLHEIADLYTDDLLAGFSLSDCPEFELWQSVETEILRQEVAIVLERLAVVEEWAGRLDVAISHWERLSQMMPLHELAQRSLMRLYARNGQRDRALRLYHAYCQQLKLELNASPSLPLIQLYECLRSGQEIGMPLHKQSSEPAASGE